jgi:hypothetical protein
VNSAEGDVESRAVSGPRPAPGPGSLAWSLLLVVLIAYGGLVGMTVATFLDEPAFPFRPGPDGSPPRLGMTAWPTLSRAALLGALPGLLIAAASGLFLMVRALAPCNRGDLWDEAVDGPEWLRDGPRTGPGSA